MENIGMYLKEGRIDDAMQFIEQFDASALPTSARCWWANNVLNVILSHYLDMSRQADIQVKARLELPEEFPVDAAELSTVFANAIENAVNACRKQRAGEALVLYAAANTQLAIEIANTYESEVQFGRDGLPLSSEQGHGIGTLSIRSFAERHRASCIFSIRDGMFCLRLLIPRRESAPKQGKGKYDCPQ